MRNVSISGLFAFASYIVAVYGRWARITFRRYGLLAVLDPSYRPRHRGTGVGVRHNPMGRAHDVQNGTGVWYMLRMLEAERMAAV